MELLNLVDEFIDIFMKFEIIDTFCRKINFVLNMKIFTEFPMCPCL